MDIIISLKHIIDLVSKNEAKFQDFKAAVLEFFADIDEYQIIDISYIYQKVYLHACLRKQKEIEEWLRVECFNHLPPIESSAIRQVFSYGKYMVRK